MSFWSLLGDCFERTSKQKQPQDLKLAFKLKVAMLRESMARKIWILHELATLGPSGPTRNTALAVCVSVAVLLCGAPSPCYALVNTSECAHTPRVLSLLSAQPRKHTHLGQVAGGEEKNLWTQTYWRDCLGIEKGVDKLFVCVFVSAHPLMGKNKTDKQNFQKVPGQSWEVLLPNYAWDDPGIEFFIFLRVLFFPDVISCYFCDYRSFPKIQQVVKTRPWIPNPFYAVQNSPPLTISWAAGFQGKLLHFSKTCASAGRPGSWRKTHYHAERGWGWEVEFNGWSSQLYSPLPSFATQRYRPARVGRKIENMGSSTNEAKSTCSSRLAAGWWWMLESVGWIIALSIFGGRAWGTKQNIFGDTNVCPKKLHSSLVAFCAV